MKGAHADAPDAELAAVEAELRRLDPGGARSAQVLRETYDQLYDGQRTGRYKWDQLFKTEKTHCGTLVEINLQREFNFADGDTLDYEIAGVETDCKYSQSLGGWMIPPEAVGHLCLVVWGEDSARPGWRMGLVRASEANLNVGVNRDGKRTLNRAGKDAILWLNEVPLPPNVLVQLDAQTVARIFAYQGGTNRLNELFRSALGRRIGRAAVATVARQHDFMKRVRANGGSRSALQPEGIIVLGHFTSHANIARSLGIPIPYSGDFVSARVTPAENDGQGVARINGGLWRIATEQDAVVAAPTLPNV